MGVGGDGAVKKIKSKREDSTSKKPIQEDDEIHKKPKIGKKHKGKKKSKSDKSPRGRSRSSTKKSKKGKQKRSKSTNKSSGEETTDNEGTERTATDIGTSVKPEKADSTCVTMWSEPVTCCVDSINRATAVPTPCGDSKCRNVCLELVKEEMGQDLTDRQVQARLCIERLSNERDYYRAEFERLLKFFEKLRAPNVDEEGNALDCVACHKKEQMIEYLQRENEVLAKEKFCLMSRLEKSGARFDMESSIGKCCKPSCKRLERERDLLKLDIERLEEEADCLRDKVKVVGENKTREYAKFQEQRIEYENVISKLEVERRELIKAQGIRRVTINALEEKVDMYTNLLRVAKEEFHRMKTQYCQLKKLHEQCDKALLDTQAQLVEVETELLNCQKRKDPTRVKKYGKETQFVPPKCPCFDAATNPDKNASFASEDVKMKMIQLDKDKDDLLNLLDIKTEKLFEFENNIKAKEDLIYQLEEQVNNLKNEMSGMQGEVQLLEEKYTKSQMALEEKTMEIKNLETQTNEKLLEVRKIQTKLEEKESLTRALQAEVEQLNKESYALVTSNHQLQTDTHNNKVQVSVALETVSELENKIKDQEQLIEEYERQMETMKNDLENCQTQMARKESEVDQLLKNKHNLQNLSEELDIENRAHEKTICDLQCECQKLRTDLMSIGSKDKLISDLNARMCEVKAVRDAFEKENIVLAKKVLKLENKLVQCICTICDTAQDKCTMMNCIFGKDVDSSSRRGKLESGTGTKDAAIQAFFCEGPSKTMKTCTSIKQVMPAVPLQEDKSSRVITSQSTLPETTDQSYHMEKDTIIASMYQTVDSISPFSYQLKHYKTEHIGTTNKSPLNVIFEEKVSSKHVLEEAEEKELSIQEPHSTSWRLSSESGKEGKKYIIDNVTSVCKTIQVGSEERIVRRRMDAHTQSPQITGKSSPLEETSNNTMDS